MLTEPTERGKEVMRELEALSYPEKMKLTIPPLVFLEMEGRFLDYVSRKELTVAFPVPEKFCNPMGNMQGGIIAAAFDNTFGPLSFLAARGPTTTIDMNTQYIRAVPAGDVLTIVARIVLRGFTTMYMTADGYNRAGKLVAMSTSNLMIIRHEVVKPGAAMDGG